MGRIISIFNQKGGVGKTTTVINLAAALAATGLRKKKVLAIDFDPQGNTTSGLGVDKENLQADIYSVLSGVSSVEDAIQDTSITRLKLLPATVDLTGFEIEAIQRDDRDGVLKELLEPVRDQYDYILIDCPPSLGLLSLNALCASDGVLIPIQAEYYALEGVSHLMRTLEMIRSSLNPNLVVEGVLLSMYDARTNLAQDVMDEVKKYFGDKVFSTSIPRNVRLAEAPSFGESIITFDRKSKGAQAYTQLARELKKRTKQAEKHEENEEG